MKKLFYIFSVLIVGCSNIVEPVTGHWHILDSSGLYSAITITDSSIFIDELNFGGEFLLKDLPDTFAIAGKSLVINHEKNTIGFLYPSLWTKVERTTNDFIKDLTSTLYLDLIPEEFSNDCILDTVPKYESPLFIGKLKPQFSKFKKDSALLNYSGYYLQFGDRLLTYNNLEDVILQTEDPFYIQIIADKNYPKEILTEILKIQEINKELIVCMGKIDIENQRIVNNRHDCQQMPIN